VRLSSQQLHEISIFYFFIQGPERVENTDEDEETEEEEGESTAAKNSGENAAKQSGEAAAKNSGESAEVEEEDEDGETRLGLRTGLSRTLKQMFEHKFRLAQEAVDQAQE
jgi:hypothetical protein